MNRLEATSKPSHSLDNPKGIGKLYLIIDQFEMYLEQENANECLFNILAEVINSPKVSVHVLLAVKSSAFCKLSRLEGLIPSLWDNQYELEHLDKDAAKEAILKPIIIFNSKHPNQPEVSLKREETFVERLLEDLREQSHYRRCPSSAWKIEAPTCNW